MALGRLFLGVLNGLKGAATASPVSRRGSLFAPVVAQRRPGRKGVARIGTNVYPKGAALAAFVSF